MQSSSLVKYHTPILVSITNAKGKKGQKKPEQQTTQTEDILNSILPPRLTINFALVLFSSFYLFIVY